MDSTLNSVVSDDYTSPDEGTTIFNGVFYDFFFTNLWANNPVISYKKFQKLTYTREIA